MIDLHLHTTASDGRCTPAELVVRAAAAGVEILAVTDHDTTAGIAEASDAAAGRGLLVVHGIEITAVEAGRDVHVLGYFFDPDAAELSRFLSSQRATRIERIAEIARRLDAFGMPVDVTPLLAAARQQNSRSIGRPRLARAMVDAGYVTDTREAFDKWLAQGRPAFVERAGSSPEAVIAIVHDAGGLASLAHPARTALDPRIPALRDAGLDAIEVYHSDQDEAATARYLQLARRLGALVTGGSDFHGDPATGLEPGTTHLPPAEWAKLLEAGASHGPR